MAVGRVLLVVPMLGTCSGLPAFASEPVITTQELRAFAEQLIGKPSKLPESTAALPETATGAIRSLGANQTRVTLKVGAAYVNLAPPIGQCFLDEAEPKDARLSGVLRSIYTGDLRYLYAYADCGQLKSWRNGQRGGLSEYGQFLMPASFIGRSVSEPATAYSEVVCGTMREKSVDLTGKSGKDIERRIDQALEGAGRGELRFVGVVGEDQQACYFALARKIGDDETAPRIQLNLSAIALISGKVIYSNLYGVHEGDRTLGELLAEQQEAMARNRRANEG